MKNVINRIFKIISSAIFTVLMILIVLIVIYIIRVNFLAGNDRLGEVRTNFYTILTQSMYPTIHAGDVVVTYKQDNNKYNKGDVITFISESNGGITITHRIQEVYKLNDTYSYKTKGDNNNTADRDIVNGSKVLGKVVLKIPKAGYVQQFLISRTGWIVAIVLPALSIIIYDILKLIRSLSKKNNKIKDDERTIKARKELKEVFENDSEKE